MRVLCADGYEQIKATLPPAERRCVVLIDPPYERTEQESEQALAALQLCLERLANAVILLWYPIKDERTLVRWLARVERSLPVPAVTLELWIYPRDSRVGLNGSGLLLINPPYRWAAQAEAWQRELLVVLDPGSRGGCSVRELGPGSVDDTGT
jgi:23S rRNA (adenine2030-N6)-methyltransferase